MAKVKMNIGITYIKRITLASFYALTALYWHQALAESDALQREEMAAFESVEEMTTEEEKLNFIIAATESTLENLKKVRDALEQFRQQEKLCIGKGSSSTKGSADALFELSRRAYQLSELIKELEISPYFRKDFLEELEMISKAYRVKSIPSARMQK